MACKNTIHHCEGIPVVGKYGLFVRSRVFKTAIVTLATCGLLELQSPNQARGFFFHATRKAVAKRILTRGINPARFKAGARYGKGLYLSGKKSTAIAEKGKKSAVIRMKADPGVKRGFLDLRNPTTLKIRRLVGKKYDLRGAVKKRIIGPKLGKSLGRKASGKDQIIQYRSKRTGGTNLFVPKKLIRRNQPMFKPEKIVR